MPSTPQRMTLTATLALLLAGLGIPEAVAGQRDADLYQAPIDPPPAQSARRLAALLRAQTSDRLGDYAFSPEGRFRHPQSGLEGRLDERGVLRFRPPTRNSSGTALALTHWGRPGFLRPLPRGTVSLRQNVAMIARRDVQERYLHGPLSIMHSVRLSKRPPGDGELRLFLDFAGLRAESEPTSPGSVTLIADHAEPRLRLGDAYARDARGRMLPVTVTALDGQASYRVDDSRATYPVDVNVLIFTYGWQHVATLSPGLISRPGYGENVDLRGVWAAVGAPGYSVDLWNRLDFLVGDLWELAQRISPRRGAPQGIFASEVALGGGRLAIGAPYSDVNGTNLGYVDIYAIDASFGNWVYETTLTPAGYPPGSTAEFGFGASLDLDGPVLAVGANRFSGGRGLVFLYERQVTGWSMVSMLTGTPFEADANFGRDLSLSGDTLLITQPGAGLQFQLPGKAYIYRRSGGVWSIEQTLSPNAGSTVADHFGAAGALAGDWLGVRDGAGELRTYSRSGAVWNETAVTPMAGTGPDGTVAVDTPYLVAGSPSESVDGHSQAGRLRFYRQTASGVTGAVTRASPAPVASGQFGISTSVDDGRVLVGEPGNERAYVYGRGTGIATPLP